VRTTPLLSAVAAAALLATAAGPAAAATSPASPAGVASSSVTVLGVSAGDRTVSAGTVALLSEMLGADPVAKVVLTPLTVDGTPHGQQTVTPGSSPSTAASADSGSLAPALAGLVRVQSPVLQATADDSGGEPATSAGATSFGGVKVLGLPVALDGSLDVGAVVSEAGALGEKTVTVTDVALPSVADLLAALGLDLSALPIDVLTELVTALDLVDKTITDAQKALDEATAAIQAEIDAAQADVDKASAELAAKTEELAGKQSELAAAEKDLQDKTAALQPSKDDLADAQSELASAQGEQAAAQATYDDAYATVKAAADLLGMTVSDFVAANSTLDIVVALDAAGTALQGANATVASATAAADQAAADLAEAQSAVDAAQAAVDLLKNAIATLQTAIDGLQATLDAALAALRDLLRSVQAEIDALLGAVLAVLDGTPLVSFDSLSLVTRAAATSNTEGGQAAEIVGGEIRGLHVLGTDVLGDVLGTSSIDLLDVTGSTLDSLTGLVGGLTGALSEVLSTVPEFPTLSIPAPQVGLLTKSTATGIEDGFGVASTEVSALSVTLPAVAIPAALALPGAVELPVFDLVEQTTGGVLTSAPVTLQLATLASNARFAPAAVPGAQTPGAQTPGTAVPQLPRTGAAPALAALGVALLAGAVVARRRQALVATDEDSIG
jgi:peptidoglycan hydrolase CwlO-like protein